MAWARAVGAVPGPARSPSPKQLEPLMQAWMATCGWALRPTLHEVGWALRRMGCAKTKSECGQQAYRVPRALADAWWEQVGGRPKRKKRAPKPKPQQRAVKPLFHTGLNPASRPLLDSLGRVYPSLGAAAAIAGEGEGNWKGLHNALRPVRNGGAPWGRWRGVLWRYLSPEETAMVPWGTRTGAVPGGWGFGPLGGYAEAVVAGDAQPLDDNLPLSVAGTHGAHGVLPRAAGATNCDAGHRNSDENGGEAAGDFDNGICVVAPSWCDGGGV